MQMNDDEFKLRSAELGLSKLTTAHPADLRNALEKGSVLAGKIPRDLHWSEEAAHTFSLTTRHQVKA